MYTNKSLLGALQVFDRKKKWVLVVSTHSYGSVGDRYFLKNRL